MTRLISKRVILCFLLAGLLGALVFAFFYNEAFPEASLDMKLTRGEVVEKSRDFLKGRGFDLSGYRNVAVFTEQRRQIDFLERHLGLKTANGLFRTTVSVWRWSVRWFKELEEVEYTVEYTPDGRLAGFQRTIPQSVPGQRLGEDEARRIAANFLASVAGLDMTRYTYIERTMEDRPHRLDQDIVFRSLGWNGTGSSEYRIGVKIQGNEVGGFSQWLKIPQTWTLAQQNMGARRNLLAGFAFFPVLLLYFAMAGVFFWRAYAGDIRWRWSFAIAGIAGAVIFLEQINKLPFSFLAYDTTQSLNIFRLKTFSMPFFSSALGFVAFVPLMAATDSIGRLCLPERAWISNIFSRTYLASGDAFKQVVLGYGMAFAAIGYVTLFYVAGQRFVGVWSPVEVNFSNNFATYFPSLTAIYTGFSAAFTEELTFRLFAIALLYRLTKRFWPAVIIPAFIWGFAHTTYPQEPIWIRGLELTIAGVLYGWIFIRYGLITTLVSHFIYNVFVGIVPQFQSGQPGLVANGLVALTLPFLALFLVRKLASISPLRRLRNFLLGQEDEGPPLSCAGPPSGTTPFNGSQAIPWKRFALFLIAGALIYGLSFLVPEWDFYGKAPPVKLTKDEGAALTDKVRKDLGIVAQGANSFTVFDDHTDSLPSYVISSFGIRNTWDRFRKYYGYRPEWVTRWYREETVRTLEISVDEKGRLMSLKEKLSETDPGARLNKDSARKVAESFLLSARPGNGEKWECIETDSKDRPNRLDYMFTFRDKAFAGGELQRKLPVIVSGNRVTFLGTPRYDVPEDWTRKREILQKGFRNSVRQLVFVFLVVGTGIFLIVHAVILIRRRTVHRDDVIRSLYWGLALGALPPLLETVNSLPRFYYGYFYQTAQSLWTYTLTSLLSMVAEVILMPAMLFCLVLLAHMVLRAWIPERGEFSTLLDPVRPSRFNSKENRQGVFLGIAAAALSTGLTRFTEGLKTWLVPDLFTPAAQTTQININQLSELLNLPAKVPQVVLASLCLIIVVAVFRRFIRKEGIMIALMAFLSFLLADKASISWSNLVIEWSVETGSLILIYLVITRGLRWNIMAYVVWIWIEMNLDAVSNFRRFVFSHSPGFFWPAIAQMAALVVPVVIILVCSLKRVNKSRAGDKPPYGTGG